MLKISPGQCRAARALIGWTQPKLVEASGLGLSTIVDFEKERREVSESAVNAIANALVAGGVIFVAENGEGPGVRLRKKSA
jgi:transcriptional regulator with XRE-family HTH domain